MTSTAVRRGGQFLAGAGALFALVLSFGWLDHPVAVVVSDLVHPAVALGAGVLLILGSMSRRRMERAAWILFGAGVILSGLGELAWAWYEVLLGVEPPFPGLPDGFYLAAYPVFAVAVLLTPRVAANKYQRVHQLVDGIVMTVGISLVAWMTVLEPIYLAAGDTGLAELLVSAAYPVGDVLLIATVGTVGVKRSLHLRDRSLWCVVGALLLMALGDIVYLTQSWAGTYVSGSALDATWLASYALFALAAAWLGSPVEQRTPRDRRLPMWHMFVPVVMLFTFVAFYVGRQFSTGATADFTIEAVLAGMGLLVAFRLLVTVAEDRYLVDGEGKQLVSVVSHELRTPLTAVQGYLDLVLTDWNSFDDDGKREMVEIAHDQVRLVTRIVTDLISTSRDSLHSTQLNLEPVDVGSLVNEVVGMLGLENMVRIEVEEGSIAEADGERLTQIVGNLLTNADRFGAGEITSVTRQVDGQIEIQVHDNGPGVPARYRDVIWERFERGARRLDASTPGSGLGLAIVRSLMVAHGGTVGYRPSGRLGGACFWVRLPAVSPQPVEKQELVEAANT